MLSNLKKLRAEKGISQQKLADAIGVTQPSINKYENHSIEPEFDTLRRMADYFDTSVDYIIGHTDVRRKIEPIEAYELNEREKKLVNGYRALTAAQKECIDKLMDTFLMKE